MRVSDRRQLILDAVHQRGLLTITEVTELVSTSEATVRRDLRHLAEEGLIRRTHGGAAPSLLVSREAPYQEKAQQVAAEKHAIAVAAARLIADGDTVAIGAGTTTFALAQQLTGVAELTVVTNSVLVCAALERAPNVHLMLSGGLLRNSTYALVGPVAEQSLAGLHVSTLYLSGNGLTAARGLSTPDVLAAAVDKRLAMSAARVVVLIDHTKIGVETMMQTVAPADIACVITDSAADKAELNGLRQLGVEVMVVDVDAADSAAGQQSDESSGQIHGGLALQTLATGRPVGGSGRPG